MLVSDTSPLLLRDLPWDTAHFGFPVATISNPGATADEVQSALHAARNAGHALVYWLVDPDHSPGSFPEGPWTALRLCEQRTYSVAPVPEVNEIWTSLRIDCVDPAEDCLHADLHGLALAAGAYSRFRLDPHFPTAAFETLYRQWMLNSLSGERADVVLAAFPPGAPRGPVAGMLTISVCEAAGTIGLVAVAPPYRGQRLGTSLMAAAHRWLIEGAVLSCQVVTQAENTAACRLYERAGYSVAQRRIAWHIWLDPAVPHLRPTRPR